MAFMKIHGHKPMDVHVLICELHQNKVGLDLQQVGWQLCSNCPTVDVDQSRSIRDRTGQPPFLIHYFKHTSPQTRSPQWLRTWLCRRWCTSCRRFRWRWEWGLGYPFAQGAPCTREAGRWGLGGRGRLVEMEFPRSTSTDILNTRNDKNPRLP